MAYEGHRKILIAFDGSEAARNAFEWYLANMMKPNDYVYGVIVPEYAFAGVTVGPLADYQALTEQFQTQHKVIEKLCSDYTADLRAKMVKGQVDSYPGGKPGETIIEQAEKMGVHGIVIGTRGLSKFKRLMLGSVSQYVIQHASCPVSVIPLSQK